MVCQEYCSTLYNISYTAYPLFRPPVPNTFSSLSAHVLLGVFVSLWLQDFILAYKSCSKVGGLPNLMFFSTCQLMLIMTLFLAASGHVWYRVIQTIFFSVFLVTLLLKVLYCSLLWRSFAYYSWVIHAYHIGSRWRDILLRV